MRCLSPMNEPADYLGVQPSTVDGVTLFLHAYAIDGEPHVNYSAVGPRQAYDEPYVRLSKEAQRLGA